MGREKEGKEDRQTDRQGDKGGWTWHPWSWCCDGGPRRATAAMLSGDAWRCRARRLIGPLCVSWHPYSAAAVRGRRRLGSAWGRFVVDRDWPVDAIASGPRCHANAMHNALPTHLAAGHWQPQKTPSGHHPLAAFLGPFLGPGLESLSSACHVGMYVHGML